MPTVVEWIQKLETKIDEQKRYAEPWEARYENKFALPFIANEYREVYGTRVDNLVSSVLEAPRTGAAAIGIDALVERLTVLGATSDDPETATAVQQAWEDNDLDVMHREAHREAMIRRLSLGAVSPSTDGRGIFTIESSEQASIHRMQGPPYDVDGYLKIWVDEWTGDRHGMLKRAAENPADGHIVYDLVEGSTVNPDPDGSNVTSRWAVSGDPRSLPGPVPVVEFAHKARLLKPPQSELESIYTLIDMADLVDGLMVFAGHFGAVPIRWATGLDIPRDPKDPTKPLTGPDGKPVMGFKPRADHFWFNSNEKAQFGQMVPASLDTYVTWANWIRNELRSQTKVASTYYALDIKSHMSAELLKTDEAPMVRRVNSMGREGSFNQAWRRGLTLLAQIEGFRGRVRPLWDDPQTRMDAQAVDAFLKAV
ncbi:MAG: phage portal protein, partial [Actinomycetia bacterium]|nr:phage portal protein [Actinomycetes bacterium]